ncbi:biopolymer transporter ExbD [Pseudooceanicola nitratireducens]|uniref:ExbD/TolR family protein n=1 Tax=Pseudooceanicola nitratireducens TaxID=517719 RepID=UPI001C938F4E|nr:biopolymer transporter ExbD [Pseudooceanicola nitratireducens]
MVKPKRRKSEREPTIALINIVFLMLVFFMVAGALAPPLDQKLTLVDTRNLDSVAPPDALVLFDDGSLSYRGTPVASAQAYMDAMAELPGRQTGLVRLVPDRDTPAHALVALSRDLRQAGATRVVVVTEQGLN